MPDLFCDPPPMKQKTRERERKLNPEAIPNEWPNGSGLYREGTGHLKSDKGLLGRSFRRGDKTATWRYLGRDKYRYLGEFASDLEARMAISRWG